MRSGELLAPPVEELPPRSPDRVTTRDLHHRPPVKATRHMESAQASRHQRGWLRHSSEVDELNTTSNVQSFSTPGLARLEMRDLGTHGSSRLLRGVHTESTKSLHSYLCLRAKEGQGQPSYVVVE